MPFDHVGITTLNVEETTAWYLAALKPLGYKKKMTVGDEKNKVHGLGAGMVPDFWVGGPADSEEVNVADFKPTYPIHMCFATNSRQVVREFHKAGVETGGKCNGPPGLRSYHKFYYGAFVLDPEGRNIEVCCHYPGIVAECGGVSKVLGVVAAAVAVGVGLWGRWAERW